VVAIAENLQRFASKHDVKKLTAVCECTYAPFVKKWPAPTIINFAPSMNDKSVIVAIKVLNLPLTV
jgi:hypothetical protein